MPFLRNCWYAAGWSDEIGETAIRRRILGEQIALYRLADGSAIAIADRCPHRFASLSQGRVVADAIECPYHGLRFDRNGACVLNPHGDGMIPPGVGVTAYPLIERYGALWIWPGDPSLARAEDIPNFSYLEDAAFTCSHGYLSVAANYQLVCDNLLDLSHVPFLHPFLANPEATSRTRVDVRQDGSAVWSYFWLDDEPITPLFQMVWESGSANGDQRAHMRWTPPSNLFLDLGMNEVGCGPETGPSLPNSHFLTPETEDRTHYFWAIGRDRKRDDAAIGQSIHDGTEKAFIMEDEPMVARVQENMAGEDFWALRPLILAGDGAALRARRMLAQKIKRENSNDNRADQA